MDFFFIKLIIEYFHLHFIDVIDVWQRICSQRQKALRDVETLEQSLQIVLNHAHDVLNKSGFIHCV